MSRRSARPGCLRSEPTAAISTFAVRRRTYRAMAAVPFDTLKLARRLESAGFPPKQAGDTAEALAEAMSGAELATKSDLALVRADLDSLRADLRAGLDSLRKEFTAEIAALRGEFKADIEL